MARKRVYQYVFSPGGASTGTIKIPMRYQLDDILAIYNTTDGICIFNFGDPALGGTVSFSAATDSDFPTAYAGVTTITLDADTSVMSAGDKLSIYVEDRYLETKPWMFGNDAIGRDRISQGEALIDADFEYGLQNTKWQNVALTNNIPNFYEDFGIDKVLDVAGYVSLIAGDDLITSNVDTTMRLENSGSPAWLANNYALIHSQTVGNTAAFVTTYVTANVNSSADRSFEVASTTGLTTGDLVLVIGKPVSGGTTVAVANITSNATTTLNVASAAGAGIIDGTYIIVETDTAGVFETMAVTGVATNVVTVQRQTNGTNAGAANISIGNDVFVVANKEVCQVDEVIDGTNVVLNRAWYNLTAPDNTYVGSVIQRLSANVELVKMSSVSTAVNGQQTIARGQFNTTALTGAGKGSPVIRMCGVWNATGDTNIPEVGVSSLVHDLVTDDYVTCLNIVTSNAEGVSLVNVGETNNFSYYPRRNPGLAVGFPMNQTDTVVRQAFPYTGADLDISSITSDGSNPSTITVNTTYSHGLVPGTPILCQFSTGTNRQYAEGSFIILSVPSTTSFTYQAKTGAAVSGTLAGVINVRSNASFVPRPFDGGVVLGPGTPTRGAAAVRTTKQYFRYQSGKGILFSSGTMLKPTFDVLAVSADGTATNSNITIQTDLEHGLNAGATITLSGITTSGYNNAGYVVTSITADDTFVVQAQETLGSTTPELGQQPRINVTAWHGSSIRAGMFDDQNGLFWESDGLSVNVVQRSSTFQLTGFVSVGAGQNLVTGDGTCRFQDQLNVGDQVVIRGMTHTVTEITDNNTMAVVPPFRGVTNQTRVKMTLRLDERIRQADFNIDPLDGTGASGYNLDASKMQMLGIEYSWYGAGYVQWMIRGQDGEFIPAHKLPNNNRNNEAYMRSGNLPARYEAINETAISSLNGAIDDIQTTITLRDATDYPPASVTYPAYVQIDSEIIKYSGKSGNNLTGCTRQATFTQWIEGASRSFTGGSAAAHADNSGVILISNTCTPLVNHWGSSVIMDGMFDKDEGYQFTFNRTSYGLPANTGEKQVAFIMRLAPSVSNSIIGKLGERDLINRAQLTLREMVVNLTTGRYLIEGILNPANIDSANTSWTGLNNLGGGFQPSFTEFSVAPRYTGETSGGLVGSTFGSTGGFEKSGVKVSFSFFANRTFPGLEPTVVSSSGSNAKITVQLTRSGTGYDDNTVQIVVTNPGSGYAVGDTLKILGNLIGGTTPTNDLNLTVAAVITELVGGERLFAIPTSTQNSGILDLTTVKQIGTSAVPGNGTFPNGPELLAIQITALSTETDPLADIQLQFQESQA